MADSLKVSLQDLGYIQSVLHNRSEDLANEHKKHHQKFLDDLDGMPGLSRNTMEDALSHFRSLHQGFVQKFSAYSELMGKTAFEYRNHDKM